MQPALMWAAMIGLLAAACVDRSPALWLNAADAGYCADPSASAPHAGYDKIAHFYAQCAALAGDRAEDQELFATCTCRMACRVVASGAHATDSVCLGRTCAEWRPTCSASALVRAPATPLRSRVDEERL